MDVKKKDLLILNILIFLTFDLMLLGAGVRTMDAGLTCPDWPLCFGKVVPKYHLGVYLEFIHRVIAGIVGILYMFFFVKVWRDQKFKKIRILSLIGLFFLVAQIIMGGLTVFKLLDAYIVTFHLTLATVFLLSLVIMKKNMRKGIDPVAEIKPLKVSKLFKALVAVAAFFVLVQIILGGLVASTYSGLVCIDFPTCNGQYFPAMTGPIAIQMFHRFGAYWLSFLLILLYAIAIFYASPMGLGHKQRVMATQILLLVGTQIYVGVMNLKYLMPAFLSVFHLALALTILLSLIRLYYSFRLSKKSLV